MNQSKRAIAAGILLGVLFPSVTKAQQLIPYIPAKDLIEKGMKAYDAGDYKKAISYYKQIPEGDTAYLLSIYEQALSQVADTNYAEAIALSKKALNLKYDDRRQVLLTMAAALDETGKKEEALQLYDSTIQLYPHDHQPYYEKAVVQFKKERYAEAEALLQQSLMRNPEHYRSHLVLGTLYTLQGRLAEAVMALEASLICTNNVSLAQTPIGLLSAIASQTSDVSKKFSEKKPEHAHPLFDEIEELVHAKIALDKGYALKTAIDDNIVRQIQIVSEKLTYDSKDKNFAMQYYVPLFKKIYDDNQFEPMILLLFSEYGIKSIDKMATARKGKARLETVKEIVFPYLNQILATRELNYEKRQTSPELYHLLNGGNTLVVGTYADKSGEKYAAGHVLFYREHVLRAEGDYDKEGRETGTWNYFHASGSPRMVEQYKDGKLTGESIEWHENGIIALKAKFNAEGVIAEKSIYAYNGILESKSMLKSKDEYEVTYYRNDGSVSSVSTLINEKIKDGTYKSYYPEGTVSRELTFKNEKQQGADKSYYANGKPEEISHYQNGMLEGDLYTYYENGNPSGKFNYLHDKKNGICEEYHEDGSLSIKRNYANGKLDGQAQYFNKEGKVYYEPTFDNDRMIRSKLYDADGKLLSEQNTKNAATSDYYNEYGQLRASVHVNKDGMAQGKASYYNLAGSLREENEYRDGKLDGTAVTYHKNGNPQVRRQYKQGESHGYYQSYYANGQPEAEGWLKDGTRQGVWRTYNPNGRLSTEYFMLNGDFNGPLKIYESNGKLARINQYDLGVMTGTTQYDSTGKIVQTLSYPKGEGLFTLVSNAGRKMYECPVLYGQRHGAFTLMAADQTVLEKGTYRFGEKDGAATAYYYNGKVLEEGMYKNGEKTGLWTDYLPDGTVEEIAFYKDGELEGADSVFSGGRLRYAMQYHDGEKEGKTFIYGEEGKLAGTLFYDRGCLIGYSYEGKDGKLLPMVPIKKGTADVQTFYANGAKAMDFHFVNNYYEGCQKLYYANGTLAEERNLKQDNFEGPLKRFNPDGSKTLEADFKKDMKQGLSNQYDGSGNLIYSASFTDGEPHGKASIMTDKGMKTIWYYYGTIE